MSNLNFKKIRFASLVIVATSFLSFGVYSLVMAGSPPYYGRDTGYGYFKNIYETGSFSSSSFVLPIISPIGEALPLAGSNAVNSVTELINLLKSYNASGDPRKVVGSAFIVNSMLGYNGPGAGTSINTFGWTDVTDRLNDRQAVGKINWNATAYNCTTNSYYQSSNQDDAFFERTSGCANEEAIIITNDDGSTYILNRFCANPMGSTGDVKRWVMTPTITISATSAYVGDTVTWSHTIKNTGNATTTKTIGYNWRSTSGITGSGASWTASGLTNGATRAVTSTYVLLAADVGKTICRVTVVNPTSNSIAETTSAGACVTVKSAAAGDPCRPTAAMTATPNTMKLLTPAARTHSGNSFSGVSYAVSVNDNGRGSVSYGPHRVYNIPIDTVPYRTSTTLQTWGPFTTPQVLDLTSRHTTGDPYTVTYKEIRKYITRFTEVPLNISRTYQSGTGRRCSGGSKKSPPVCTTYPIYSTYSYQYLSYTVVYYSDGSTSTYSNNGTTNINSSDPFFSKYDGNGTGDSWTAPTNANGVNGVGQCYDYILKSNSLNSFGSKLETGESVTINPSVSNSSWTQANYTSFYNTYRTQTKSKNTQWQITQFTIGPNSAVLSNVGGGNSSSDPCTFFDPARRSSCVVKASGTTVFDTAGNPSSSVSTSYTVPDTSAGTKVCFAFSVKPSQSDPKNSSPSSDPSDVWNHAPFDSTSNCVIVVKKPKTQIWGGDLWSAGAVQSSTSVKSGNWFGSWVEYGIVAKNTIISNGTKVGTASGSAFAAYGTQTAPTTFSVLSFANNPLMNANCGTLSSGSPGCYSSARTIHDVAASFAGGASIPFASLAPDSLNSGVYTAGNITLNASTLSQGKSVVIVSTGTVTINGDLKYNDGPYTDITKVPQLVIIANRIVINRDVVEVNAWLVGTNTLKTGSIETCSDPGNTINSCNKQLKINGPVMADKLYLYRTYGSEPGLPPAVPASDTPAEIFNLRADAYLWGVSRAMDTTILKVTVSSELPPRN